MRLNCFLNSCAIVTALAASGLAHADVFHYSNVLIGDRAMGLGGAYTAVSDDASGVYYNPAGLAFSLSNDVSGSTNALNIKKTRYLKTIGNKDWVEESQGLFPSFFGASQKLDSFWEGLSAGFAVYSTDSDLKDQNDLLLSPTADVKSFHRVANIRASTLNIGVAAGKMFHPRFAMGLSVTLTTVDELTQSYQDSVIKTSLTPVDAQKGDVFRVTSENFREHLFSRAITPAIGAQATLGQSWSIGVSARMPFLLSETYEGDVDHSEYMRFADFSVATKDDVDTSKLSTDTVSSLEPYLGHVARLTPAEKSIGKSASTKINVVFGDLPIDIRAGVAWFASSRLLWTFDTDVFLPSGDTGLSVYQRALTTNFATGAEYYVLPNFPVRLGFFTNYDVRKKIDTTIQQTQYINYYGASLFAGIAQENSQVNIGATYQRGSGEALMIRGSDAKQDIRAYILTGAFSATHSF